MRELSTKISLNNKVLNLFIKNKTIPHAILFHSSNSSELVFDHAYNFAKSIFCDKPLNFSQCNNCKSCTYFNNAIHPDLLFLFPTPENSEKKEDRNFKFLKDWRYFITSQEPKNLLSWINFIDNKSKHYSISKSDILNMLNWLNGASFSNKGKIVFLWQAQEMNIFAYNSLLKILEEPNNRTYFFLITDDKLSLSPTILSRCQEFYINKDNFQNNSLPTKDDILIDFKNLMTSCYTLNYKYFADFSEKISKEIVSSQIDFLNLINQVLLDAVKLNFNISTSQYSEEFILFLSKFSKTINVNNTLEIIKKNNRNISLISKNINAKIFFHSLFISLIKIFEKHNC